jgi:hypothetical protein
MRLNTIEEVQASIENYNSPQEFNRQATSEALEMKKSSLDILLSDFLNEDVASLTVTEPEGHHK